MKESAAINQDVNSHCDYRQLYLRFQDLFRPGRSCVVTADLDAILCSLLLRRALEWNLVGVYTPQSPRVSTNVAHSSIRENKWAWALGQSAPVFIGVDVFREGVDSLGGGVVLWAPEAPDPFAKRHVRAFNPNLLRGVTRRRIHERFPFGLSCFLMLCLAEWGMLDQFERQEGLPALLLYVNRGYLKSVRDPSRALWWADWLLPNETLDSVFPLSPRFGGLHPKSLVERFAGFSLGLESVGISRRNQRVIAEGPGQSGVLRDLDHWLRQAIGLGGCPDVADRHWECLWEVERRFTRATSDNFRKMLQAKPLSYAITASGQHGLRYDSLKP